MINPAPHIRKAFYQCLNNQVWFNSSLVPVYDSEGRGEQYMVLIGEQSIQDESTKHSFCGTCQQLIEIVSEDKGFAARRAADEIGNSVMHLVQPSPRGIGPASAEFQIFGLTRLSHSYIVEDGGSGSKIVRMLIRYQFKINQINY